jgi:hypothetical protein
MQAFKLSDATGLLDLPFLFNTKEEAQLALTHIRNIWENNGFYDVVEVFDGHPDLCQITDEEYGDYFDGLADCMDVDEFPITIVRV